MSFSVVEERSFQTHGNHWLSHVLAAAFATEPHHCFANAWRCFMLSPDLFREHGSFVEGWHVIELTDDVIVVEHGWLERNGRIVDPSIVLVAPSSLPVFYYPGVVRSWEETEALEGAMFPRVRFDGKHGEDGLGHPSYKAARDAAVCKVYALAQASIPPKAMHFWVSRDEAPSAQPLEDRPGPTFFEVSGNNTLDIRQSCKAALQIQALPGRCWHNARDALQAMPSLASEAHYVEGWLVEEVREAIRVVEHGWIECGGAIIDPTLVTDDPPLSVEYVPGERLSWPELQAYTGQAFPRARYAPHSSVSYQHACQHALAQAEKLAWKTGRPVRCCPGELTMLSADATELVHTCWDFPVPAAPSERILRFLDLTRGTIEL